MPIQIVLMFLPFLCMMALFAYFTKERGKYKNIEKGGPFFFENGCFVLNSTLPCPIPLSEVEVVELKYNVWKLENSYRYRLWCTVRKKDGKKRRVQYTVYRGSTCGTPQEMAQSLAARGIRCIIIKQ